MTTNGESVENDQGGKPDETTVDPRPPQRHDEHLQLAIYALTRSATAMGEAANEFRAAGMDHAAKHAESNRDKLLKLVDIYRDQRVAGTAYANDVAAAERAAAASQVVDGLLKLLGGDR